MDDIKNSIKRDIKLIVTDIDGTLLNNDHQMSDRNRDVIRKAIAQGIKVVLATGKTRASAEGIIAALGLNTPGVFVQGLMIYNPDGTIKQQQLIDIPATRRIIQYAESNGFEVIAYSGNRLIARHANSPISDIAKYGEPAPQAVGSLVNVLNSTQIHKLVIVGGDSNRLKALRWQLNQQVGNLVTFTTAAVLSSLEVLPKGGNKANGVRMVMKELGIHAENTMAIGDAENDIEMLQLVGWGVAVGNASEEVKKSAKAVVSSNQDDGVAEAIEKYALAPEKPVETPKATETEAVATSPAPETKSEEKESN